MLVSFLYSCTEQPVVDSHRASVNQKEEIILTEEEAFLMPLLQRDYTIPLSEAKEIASSYATRLDGIDYADGIFRTRKDNRIGWVDMLYDLRPR